MHSRLRPLVWNLSGQGVSALLGLLLVKLSVSSFSVSVYGWASLLIGLQLFVRNAGLNPLLNLAIYAAPREGAHLGMGWLYRTTTRCLFTALAVVPLIFLAAGACLHLRGAAAAQAALVLSLWLAAEAWKTARLNLLHSRGLHGPYTLWIILDAASKPLAVGAILLLGLERTAVTLVGAQAAGAVLILLATKADGRIEALTLERRTDAPIARPRTWVGSHRAFLLPLVGVGLTGWVTGLSDRYLVNHFLGTSPAGLYAGIYGLFSAPFLISGGAVILAVRPTLLRLSGGEGPGAWTRLHRRSLGAMALGVAALALLLFLLRAPLVRLALAPAYLQALPVVPGLVIGNAILALGTFLEQAFYLERRTGRVLLKQAVGSACALLFVALALPRWGLVGAGWACPGYTSTEFLFGWFLLNHKSIHRSVA